jgi:hypothetical protein
MIELPENIRIDESLAREAAPQLKLSLAALRNQSLLP